jgi:hypothetical protein
MAEPKAVKKVIELRSGMFASCPECGGSQTHMGASMEQKINHVLSHGYKILHIGQETSTSDSGAPWQETVAILGK